MKFIVVGKIVGKQRPRFNSRQKRAYTPQKTADYEELIRIEFINQCKYLIIQDYIEAVKIKIEAYFEPAKSTSKKKPKEMLGEHVLKAPDLDNIAKSVCDALNGLAYRDDRQVCELIISKRYADTERLEIELEYV